MTDKIFELEVQCQECLNVAEFSSDAHPDIGSEWEDTGCNECGHRYGTVIAVHDYSQEATQ